MAVVYLIMGRDSSARRYVLEIYEDHNDAKANIEKFMWEFEHVYLATRDLILRK